MLELEINGLQFKTTLKLNAVQQFMLSKRLVPVIDVFIKMSRMGSVMTTDIVTMIAEAIAKLSDDDCLYIFDMCLTNMQCQRDGVWGSVWNHSAKMPQYADLAMPAMLQLVYAVVMDNLGSFMPAPLTPSGEGTSSV